MRLWHKDLIHALPRQQLLGQWRECCLIAKNIHENGTPNHILVNKIMNYPLDHFYTYCKLIDQEMFNRGYKTTYKSLARIYTELWTYIDIDELFNGWHNDRYYIQCIYNLQEKYDCGGISQEEWNKILNNWGRRYNT